MIKYEINPVNEFTCLSDMNVLGIEIDLVYSNKNHAENQFIQFDEKSNTLYRSDAKMWIHKTLHDILIKAVDYLDPGYKLVIKDAFRSCEAQYAMGLFSKSEKLYKQGFISRTGEGSHPLGMAIDLVLKYQESNLDMGSGFDDFSFDEYGEAKASRKRKSLSIEQIENQRLLEKIMLRGALDRGNLLVPLENENWDFRFPKNVTSLKYVLKSIARILKIKIDCPNIIDYEQFLYLWREFFCDSHERRDNLLRELGHIVPPKETSITFTQKFKPLFDIDLPEQMRMTNCELSYLAKAAFREQENSLHA